jgi:plastocyanin
VKKLLTLSATVALAASLAVPAIAGTRTVKVGDDWYGSKNAKPTISVKKGTTVKWVWVGSSAHNVKASGPANFISRTFVKGSFKHKMTRRGTYKIVCTIHPGMTMKLKVT